MSDRKSARRDVLKPARPAPPKAGRPFTLTARWAALVLGLLTILFFHQLVLDGKTFVSPDAMNPVGFVRIGEQSLYQDHVYPLWNPYVFLGMPSFASGAYNPLIYPPDWPLTIVNKVVPLPDMTWMLLYYFLGGLFMFYLARELGARAEGALLAAVAFVFAPNLVAVGSHGHGSQLVDSAYLPLMLWLAARWMRRGGLHHLAWLALAGGFQLLRAHVQICFYTWIAIALYLVVEWVAMLLKRRGELAPDHAARRQRRPRSGARLRYRGLLQPAVAGLRALLDPRGRNGRWRRHGLRDGLVHGALRAALGAGAGVGGLRRRDLLGRDALHRLPERLPGRRGGAARHPGVPGRRSAPRLRAGAGRALARRRLRALLPSLRLPLRPPAAVQQVPRAGDGHHPLPAGGHARHGLGLERDPAGGRPPGGRTARARAPRRETAGRPRRRAGARAGGGRDGAGPVARGLRQDGDWPTRAAW